MTESNKCQNCHQQFLTDSPYHDAYCGRCRTAYRQYQKDRVEYYKLQGVKSLFNQLFGFYL